MEVEILIEDLKNGYYLSTYLVCNKDSYDYGISLRHDQCIGLWLKEDNDIKLIHYWELERLTRFKQHYFAFKTINDVIEFINYLLDDYGLSLNDIEEVIGTNEISTIDESALLKQYPSFSYHSLFHLFSSILMDTSKFYNDNIIAFAVDGGPDSVLEWEKGINNSLFYVGCIVNKGKMDVFSVESPGLLWLMAVIMFKQREGTLMALASASKSEIIYEKVDLPELINPNDMTDVTDYILSIQSLVNMAIEGKIEESINFLDTRFSIEENRLSMIMKILQRKSIEIMEENVNRVVKKYEINPKDYYLSIGGGYGLNCPTNSFLCNKFMFKGLLIPPCVNDSGQAFGMGLWYFYSKMNFFNYTFKSPFLGDVDVISESDLKKMYGIYIESINKYDSEQVVEDILKTPVVWFDGRAEIGPRALGHRSIIGNPMDSRTKDIINTIKKRQWWRPVAPIVLESKWKDWFVGEITSPYMLCTNQIIESKVSLIPAVSHLDGSARVQLMSEKYDMLMTEILIKMYEKTGVPILCNTSLNDAGEPIINTVDQVFNFALRKKITVIYINGMRIALKNHQLYREVKPLCAVDKYCQFFNYDSGCESERKQVLRYYYTRPNLRNFDIHNEEDYKKVAMYYKNECEQSNGSLNKLFCLNDK